MKFAPRDYIRGDQPEVLKILNVYENIDRIVSMFKGDINGLEDMRLH